MQKNSRTLAESSVELETYNPLTQSQSPLVEHISLYLIPPLSTLNAFNQPGREVSFDECAFLV